MSYANQVAGPETRPRHRFQETTASHRDLRHVDFLIELLVDGFSPASVPPLTQTDRNGSIRFDDDNAFQASQPTWREEASKPIDAPYPY